MVWFACQIYRLGVVFIQNKSVESDGDLQQSSLVVDDVRSVIDGVKDELDEHRNSINDNTDEIQSNFAYLCELDKKIEMLSARVEGLFLAVGGSSVQREFKVAPLSGRERDVFMALYALGEVFPFVSYKQIAKKLGMSESLVSGYLAGLIEKGVPVVKKYDSGIAYVKLDDLFRQLQAKKALVGVNSVLSCWL